MLMNSGAYFDLVQRIKAEIQSAQYRGIFEREQGIDLSVLRYRFGHQRA